MNKIILTIISMLSLTNNVNAQTVDHTFNYQGELRDNNIAITDVFNFTVQAYTDSMGNNPIGNLAEYKDASAVQVTNGLFNLEGIDLGASVFDGMDIWLKISVKKPIDAVYTPLTPLQKMQSVPYATTLIDKGATDGQVLTFDDVNGWSPVDANSGTDNQTLSISANNLSITSGNTVSLPVQENKSTYTVWGRTACGSGDTQLYSGIMSVVGSTSGAGTHPICLNSPVNKGWVFWNGGLVWRANAVSVGQRGEYLDSETQVDCSVCQGDTYVNWGDLSCATGWNTIYDGFIGSMGTSNGTDWSAGGTVCLDDSQAGSWTNWDRFLVLRAKSDGLGGRVQYKNGDMLCRVCN